MHHVTQLQYICSTDSEFTLESMHNIYTQFFFRDVILNHTIGQKLDAPEVTSRSCPTSVSNIAQWPKRSFESTQGPRSEPNAARASTRDIQTYATSGICAS